MNNRYTFRGKRKDNGEWVEGYYVCNGEHCYIFSGKLGIINKHFNWERYEVIPETVGQCTGLKDKNGKLIFEGDIMISPIGRKAIVSFGTYKPWSNSDSDDFESWKLSVIGMNNSECGLGSRCAVYMKVIGNIHDNPELLEVEK